METMMDDSSVVIGPHALETRVFRSDGGPAILLLSRCTAVICPWVAWLSDHEVSAPYAPKEVSSVLSGISSRVATREHKTTLGQVLVWASRRKKAEEDVDMLGCVEMHVPDHDYRMAFDLPIDRFMVREALQILIEANAPTCSPMWIYQKDDVLSMHCGDFTIYIARLTSHANPSEDDRLC